MKITGLTRAALEKVETFLSNVGIYYDSIISEDTEDGSLHLYDITIYGDNFNINIKKHKILFYRKEYATYIDRYEFVSLIIM